MAPLLLWDDQFEWWEEEDLALITSPDNDDEYFKRFFVKMRGCHWNSKTRKQLYYKEEIWEEQKQESYMCHLKRTCASETNNELDREESVVCFAAL